jgi:hypothetical protein
MAGPPWQSKLVAAYSFGKKIAAKQQRILLAYFRLQKAAEGPCIAIRIAIATAGSDLHLAA